MKLICDCLEVTGDSLFPIDLRISNQTLSELRATPAFIKSKLLLESQEVDEQVVMRSLYKAHLIPYFGRKSSTISIQNRKSMAMTEVAFMGILITLQFIQPIFLPAGA